MCYQANAWHYSIKFGCCLDWESLQFRLIPFAVCFWEAENLYNLRCPQSLMGSHDLYLGLLYLHCTSAVKQVDCSWLQHMEPSANIEKFSERSKVSQSPTKLVLRCVARESPRWLCVRVWWDPGAHCTWGSVVIFHKLLPSSSSFHQSFNSYVRNCLHTFAIVCHFLQRSLFSPVTPSITFAFMVHLMNRIQQLPDSVLRRQPLPSQLRQPLEILRCKPLPSLPRRCLKAM